MIRRVYIGYDQREQQAYKVAMRSLCRNSSVPLGIMPVALEDLEILTRPIERKDGKLWCPISEAPMATEFAISRFCVPFMQKSGLALFVDCDVLFKADVEELFALADPEYAVQVVKHSQEHGSEVKMDGQVQTYYSRKNWSSIVIWNLDHESNKRLTLEELNTRPGRDLHAFMWLKDEEIGGLPLAWNWLVGVYPQNPFAKILHFTIGTPDIAAYENCDHNSEWLAELNIANAAPVLPADRPADV